MATVFITVFFVINDCRVNTILHGDMEAVCNRVKQNKAHGSVSRAGKILTLVLLNPDIPCFANSVDPGQLASEEAN